MRNPSPSPLRALAVAAAAALALPIVTAGAASATTAPHVPAKAVKTLGTTTGHNTWVGSIIVERDGSGYVYRITTSPGGRAEFRQGGRNGWVTANVYTANGQDKVGLHIPADYVTFYPLNGGSWAGQLN